MAKRVDHAVRKRQVAEKALRLFSQVGYENVSLIMIAAAAGISRTVIYRYFCSKREVMDAAIVTVLDEIAESCRPILASREPAMRRLEGVCHSVVDVMFKHREFVIAVFDFVIGMVRTGADMSRSIADYTSGTRGAILTLIEHARRRGEVPEVLVPDRIADAIYSEFESCAMRIVLGTEQASDRARVRFSDILRAISTWK